MSVFYFYFIRFFIQCCGTGTAGTATFGPDRNKIPFLDPAPVPEPNLDPVRHKIGI
jgi:hypothetical protein